LQNFTGHFNCIILSLSSYVDPVILFISQKLSTSDKEEKLSFVKFDFERFEIEVDSTSSID